MTWLLARLTRLPPMIWLALAVVAVLFVWHGLALRQARQDARAELKAEIATETRRLDGRADAAANRVLACRGTWNKDRGLCEP